MKNIFLKSCLILTICILSFLSYIPCTFAESKTDIQIRESIMQLLKDLEEGSNKHDIDKVASLYASNYMSSDNLDKNQVISLLKETWESYPNIKYTSEIKDVRFSDNWAAVETYDNALGTTAKPSEITHDTGNLIATSHSIIYLRRIGKEWKIVGDYTYYEKAIVKFGNTKNLEIKVSTPEQVQAGQMYSATVSMEVPVGSFAVGSITQEPIIYPSIKQKEKFRTINQSIGNLERVFESNDTNNNELVTTTVGITELTEDNLARPTVELKGICIIGNRVNVIPNSTFDLEEYKITHKQNLDNQLEPEVEEPSSVDPQDIVPIDDGEE